MTRLFQGWPRGKRINLPWGLPVLKERSLHMCLPVSRWNSPPGGTRHLTAPLGHILERTSGEPKLGLIHIKDVFFFHCPVKQTSRPSSTAPALQEAKILPRTNPAYVDLIIQMNLYSVCFSSTPESIEKKMASENA